MRTPWNGAGDKIGPGAEPPGLILGAVLVTAEHLALQS